MTSRNPSEPFDEIGHPSGAAARMVEDTAAKVAEPVAAGETAADRIMRHTYAADRTPAVPLLPAPREARPESVARGLGHVVGEITRRYESARAYLTDTHKVQADLLGQARRYPMQALAGSVLAGLIVGRLLRRK